MTRQRKIRKMAKTYKLVLVVNGSEIFFQDCDMTFACASVIDAKRSTIDKNHV